MVPLPSHLIHFPSCDIKHIIFRKTAVTHLFFNSRPQIKTKVILDVISNNIIHKNDTVRQNSVKNVFKKCYRGNKNDFVCISVMMPDRPIVKLLVVYILSFRTLNVTLGHIKCIL